MGAWSRCGGCRGRHRRSTPSSRSTSRGFSNGSKTRESHFPTSSEKSSRRTSNAGAAFGAFLDAFPESRYRDDATFWQGERLYALREFEPAFEKFRALVETHAESPRAPGAKLKIGFILHELGQSAEAAAVLRGLVSTAPDSSEAKLARDRLARLE